MSELSCPSCGADLEEIGCEKTTICPECGSEWKYGANDWGDRTLEAVEENDSIYWDR